MNFDEYRHGVLTWTRVSPAVRGVMGVTIVVYFLQVLFQGLGIDTQLGLSRESIGEGKLWTFASYFVAHDARLFFMMLFNLVTLGTLGSLLEEEIGPKAFVTLYVLAGVLSGSAHLVFGNGMALGAYGAVSAVVAALVVLHHGARIDLRILPPMPVWTFGWIFLVVSFCYMLVGLEGTPAIHGELYVAGAIIGVAFITYFNHLLLSDFQKMERSTQESLRSMIDAIGKHPSEETVSDYVAGPANSVSSDHSGTSASATLTVPTEAEVNQVLDKLSTVGLANLSERDRDILDKAAEDRNRS